LLDRVCSTTTSQVPLRFSHASLRPRLMCRVLWKPSLRAERAASVSRYRKGRIEVEQVHTRLWRARAVGEQPTTRAHPVSERRSSHCSPPTFSRLKLSPWAVYASRSR
jgi:hypothetical protein